MEFEHVKLESELSEESPDALPSMDGEVIDQCDLFERVPLAILRVEAVTDFDLHLRVPHSDRFVLYRSANLVFEEQHRAQLERSQVREVYIARTARREYLGYVEEHLESVIHDPRLPAEEKSSLLYECAAQLAQDVFEKPWVGGSIKRAQRIVQHTVDCLLSNSDYLANLIGIMSCDYYTYTHSVNVCVFGLALGLHMGMSSAELHELGAGLLLHDVGKSTIDPAILTKPGPLSPAEWDVIRTHPERGVEILSQTQSLQPSSLAVVLEHHERCSGKGYPRGLRGHEIHIFAKIAALADVFDALTTQRPYRDAMESFAAIRLMQTEMRGDLHPQLLRQLILAMGCKTRPRTRRPATGTAREADQRVAA